MATSSLFTPPSGPKLARIGSKAQGGFSPPPDMDDSVGCRVQSSKPHMIDVHIGIRIWSWKRKKGFYSPALFTVPTRWVAILLPNSPNGYRGRHDFADGATEANWRVMHGKMTGFVAANNSHRYIQVQARRAPWVANTFASPPCARLATTITPLANNHPW